jgi:hypothetical protein
VKDIPDNAIAYKWSPFQDIVLSRDYVNDFSVQQQTWTLLHELSHLALHTGDYGYISTADRASYANQTGSASTACKMGAGPAYNTGGTPVFLSHAQKMDNADTYAGFLMGRYYAKTTYR